MAITEPLHVTPGPDGSAVEKGVPIIAKKIMGFRGMTARQLAERLHMHPNRLSERMTGKARFTVAELVDMATVLDVDVVVFFRDPADLDTRVQNWKKMNPGPRGVPMRDEQLQFTFGNVARPLAVVRSPH